MFLYGSGFTSFIPFHWIIDNSFFFFPINLIMMINNMMKRKLTMNFIE